MNVGKAWIHLLGSIADINLCFISSVPREQTDIYWDNAGTELWHCLWAKYTYECTVEVKENEETKR